MISFRMLALAAIVVYLLPTDPERQQRFTETSVRAMTWASTFCDRNAKTCEMAGDAWDVMKAKASFGAQVVYGIVVQRFINRTATGAVEGSQDVFPLERSQDRREAARQSDRGTLTRADLLPAWRGR